MAVKTVRHSSQLRKKAPTVAVTGAQPKTAYPKIGILVVAYNAVNTLASVLDRIPNDFRSKIARVLVCDDHSQDSTYLVGLGYQQVAPDLPISVIRHPQNLGYGGNQKAGYRMAIESGLDIVVLLHGDGQYAPECLPEIVAPLERGECDAVFGSRMMTKGGARRGGMPLYKYVGNRILTKVENRMLGTDLSEFHSGYRAYSVKALANIPFEQNSDGFNFDTQIIIQLHDSRRRIVEVPIPTYYGDEISHVNGMKYAKDVTVDVLRYRMQKVGFASGDLGQVGDEYALKQGDSSSHGHVLRWLTQMPPSRILDLGCSSGLLGAKAKLLGHSVTGVDVLDIPAARERLDRFFIADLDRGIPKEVGRDYDIVLCADVIEHVREPEKLLEQIRDLLTPRGMVIGSVPNFGHWYSRGRTALGLFDYDQRGLLDHGHVRFFTRRSLRRIVRAAGYDIVRTEYVGLPLDVLTAGERSRAGRIVRHLDRFLVMLRPTLFAYQFVLHLEVPPPGIVAEVSPRFGRPSKPSGR